MTNLEFRERMVELREKNVDNAVETVNFVSEWVQEKIEYMEAMADEINANIEELDSREKELKLREQTAEIQSKDLQKRYAELVKKENEVEGTIEAMERRDNKFFDEVMKFLTQKKEFESRELELEIFKAIDEQNSEERWKEIDEMVEKEMKQLGLKRGEE